MQFTTVPVEPTRDRFGRPMITPPGGGKPVAYTRVTTVANTLDDLFGLMAWKQRQTAVGLADRPDLQLAVTTHRDDKQQMDRICEQAMEAAASSKGATTGTAIHKLTEMVDRGEKLPTLTDETRADLEAYRQATQDLQIVALEQFRVHDELKVAGTADRIYELPSGQRIIGDVKTGRVDYAAQKIAVQLALYSRAVSYDPNTGERAEGPGVEPTYGIVVHLPAGQGKCTLHMVNLQSGWEAAEQAMWVRGWRKRKNLLQPFEVPKGELHTRIANARSVEQLEQLYHDNSQIWSDRHTTLARSVKQSLLAAA